MKKQGTILYLSNFELPDKDAASHRVLNNARIFAGLGYNVVFLDTDSEQDIKLLKKEPCFGFERWSIRKINKYLYSIAEHIEVAEQYDDLQAIIAYNHPALGLWRLKRYCNQRKIKIIADTTEWYSAEGPNLIHRVLKWLDTTFRMQFVQPRLDGIIAISNYLDEYYRDKLPTVVLPPLTDPTEGKWNIEGGVEPETEIHILYAGVPGKHKDKLSLIINALSQCDKSIIRFKVMGITKENFLSMYPEDEELLSEMRESVSFLGKVSHLEVIKELRTADFSMFYREETRVTKAGFPTKFAEAITCGTPVLTNHNSDLANYLIEGVNGYWIDNIEDDLRDVLSMDTKILKNVKNLIDRRVFDYRNYSISVESWLERLE